MFKFILIINIFLFITPTSFSMRKDLTEVYFKKQIYNYFKSQYKNKSNVEKKQLQALSGFFSSLSLSEIYRLSQFPIDSNWSKNIITPSEIVNKWPVTINSQIKFLYAKKNIFYDSDLNLEPDEYDEIKFKLTEFSEFLPYFDLIDFNRIVQNAKNIYQFLKEDSFYGQIYDIVYHWRVPGFFRVRAVYLSRFEQKKIDEIFKNIEVSDDSILTNQLLLSESQELLAISKSAGLFENFTFLSGDWGGWFGNIFSFLAASSEQTVCHEEAMTFYYFIKVLEDRHLLHYFKPISTILRIGHEATLIQNLRTLDFYVVDSWIEDGGVPARIYTKEDWVSNKDDNYLFKNLKSPKD